MAALKGPAPSTVEVEPVCSLLGLRGLVDLAIVQDFLVGGRMTEWMESIEGGRNKRLGLLPPVCGSNTME
tara:strand:- start:2271 stop:2480 length:210 start_codon:yes stop_codon:yes gene_type:complete